MARYRKHIIVRGETIQSIASRYTGDNGFWRNIVSYNGLKHPYIVDSTGEKLLNPSHLVTLGDTIIIPIEQNVLDVGASTLGISDKDAIMNLALGTDLSGIDGDKAYQQYGTRDEVFELTADEKGDIQMASGVDNIKQAIISRLLTRKGSLINHPNYGTELETLIGSPVNMMTLKLINDEIISNIKKDRRISRVEKLHSSLDGEIYSGEFEIQILSFDELFTITITEQEQGIRIT